MWDKERYYFHEGTSSTAYHYLGAHASCVDEEYHYTFRVFAPQAERVFLVAEFTDWGEGTLMLRETEGGIFSLIVKSDSPLTGKAYKFRIEHGGRSYLRGDPYAFASRGGDDGASLLLDPFSYSWKDEAYLAMRRARGHAGALSSPLAVFEVHLASFARRGDGSYLSYGELAEALLAYASYMGYTHVELLPVAEYPYDASWGYQVCAYYAPSARFGTPEDFCAFVDRLHAGGLGVILDWVPAHFPKDEWGLYRFDGTPLYEYKVPWRQESRSWGTAYFDLGSREVRSFLISNALFWLREYHIDGLRVDAVASMLYLDYDRKEGEWEPNAEGTNISREAEEFFRALSIAKDREMPEALLIAEESTSYPGVTGAVDTGGLGFSLKWNMGFANDFFAYLAGSPDERREGHRALNFPITYAFSERYILPVSHDEVVYGKRSLFSKLYERGKRRADAFRAALLFLMTFPGKKHLFMGTEFASPYEWDYDHALPWETLLDAEHDALREYVAALNRFYLRTPALYELDFCKEGFSWLLPDENERSLVAFVRRDARGGELIVVISFSSQYERGIALSLPKSGLYKTVFSTEGPLEDGYHTRGVENRLILDLPPAFGLVLRRKETILTLL